MRKGKLIIKKKLIFKSGDKCFDTIEKIPMVVDQVDGKNIYGVNRITGSPLKVLSEHVIEMLVQDTVEEKAFFELAVSQQAYMFKAEGNDMFRFITIEGNSNTEEVVVLCKEIALKNTINFITPIADAYGLYVASQKSISEPAKKFSDWYFNISV